MDYLQQALSSPDSSPIRTRLDRAALDMARIEFPDLEHEPFLNQMNEIAASLGDRLRNFNDGRDFVETAQRYLFGELGFHANETNFYDPMNSCLNQVLERRTGIPITLSLLYMEVARRLQMPVYGIALPNRFLVQFDDGRYAAYIDPFGGGAAVTPGQCFALAGVQVPDPSLLARATHKQILMRMLHNLQRVYMQVRNYDRAILVLNQLLVGAPDAASLWKLRGALLLDRKEFTAAASDFEQYLRLEPLAQEADALREQISSIRRWVAQQN